MTVTFFGHAKFTFHREQYLQTVLENLIVNEGASDFYVGNNGEFDRIVRSTLEKLQKIYPHINYTVVLAYMPTGMECEDSHTLFPEQVAGALRRFAIDKRNRWMLERASVVVTYVICPGGASKYMELARKKGKRVINLGEIQSGI